MAGVFSWGWFFWSSSHFQGGGRHAGHRMQSCSRAQNGGGLLVTGGQVLLRHGHGGLGPEPRSTPVAAPSATAHQLPVPNRAGSPLIPEHRAHPSSPRCRDAPHRCSHGRPPGLPVPACRALGVHRNTAGDEQGGCGAAAPRLIAFCVRPQSHRAGLDAKIVSWERFTAL